MMSWRVARRRMVDLINGIAERNPPNAKGSGR
jgi:hypothetical protein